MVLGRENEVNYYRLYINNEKAEQVVESAYQNQMSAEGREMMQNLKICKCG